MASLSRYRGCRIGPTRKRAQCAAKNRAHHLPQDRRSPASATFEYPATARSVHANSELGLILQPQRTKRRSAALRLHDRILAHRPPAAVAAATRVRHPEIMLACGEDSAWNTRNIRIRKHTQRSPSFSQRRHRSRSAGSARVSSASARRLDTYSALKHFG